MAANAMAFVGVSLETRRSAVPCPALYLDRYFLIDMGVVGSKRVIQSNGDAQLRAGNGQLSDAG